MSVAQLAQLASFVLKFVIMEQYYDVQVFGKDGFVMSVSKLELVKSQLFKNIFGDMNICDTCTEPMAITLADESSEVIKAALHEVTWRPGLTIIQGI